MRRDFFFTSVIVAVVVGVVVIEINEHWKTRNLKCKEEQQRNESYTLN